MTKTKRPLDLEDIMAMSDAELSKRQKYQWRHKKGESDVMHAVCSEMQRATPQEYRDYLIKVARRRGSTADA